MSQNTVEITSKEPTLRQGDAGEGVVELQHLLEANGSALPDMNGQFDPKTLAAVISFQQKQCLKVNGIVDYQVWQALRAGADRSKADKA